MSCISYEGKAVFHHIFKCGGQSITDWFYTSFEKIGNVYGGRPTNFEKLMYRTNAGTKTLRLFLDEFAVISGRNFEHPGPGELSKFFHRKNMHDVTIMTVTRNPFDWHLSMYKYACENWRHRNHRIVKRMSFDEYIEWVELTYPNLTLKSLMPEKPRDGQLIIGKLEDLQGFLEKVKKIYPFVDTEVPVINASKNKAGYRSYYSDKSRKIIQRLNKVDFEHFQYEF